MTERLTKITMQAFRGVRDVYEIDLSQGQSLLMYGDNGTGKSTLADAIEWFFTGDIELLAKEGRDHAVRHLGALKEQQTLVAISTNGELGGVCTPKSPNKEAIEAASRETFLLRGRTIADFVDKSKGEKWGALQRLLGLGAIDELRADLQRARNDLKKSRDDASAKLKASGDRRAGAEGRARRRRGRARQAREGVRLRAAGAHRRLPAPEPPRDHRAPKDVGGRAQSRERGAASRDREVRREADVAALGAWNETLEGVADKTEIDLLGAAARYVADHPDLQELPALREEGVRATRLRTAPDDDAVGDAGASLAFRQRRARRAHRGERALDASPGPRAVGRQGARDRRRALARSAGEHHARHQAGHQRARRGRRRAREGVSSSPSARGTRARARPSPRRRSTPTSPVRAPRRSSSPSCSSPQSSGPTPGAPRRAPRPRSSAPTPSSKRARTSSANTSRRSSSRFPPRSVASSSAFIPRAKTAAASGRWPSRRGPTRASSSRSTSMGSASARRTACSRSRT